MRPWWVKRRVYHHQVIHVEQSISLKLILRQNFCDGDKVNIDLSHMRRSKLLHVNTESMVDSSV
jgi:hypothetical protein